MIGDRDTGVAGETGFVGFKDTHHHRQQQEQLGGGCARVSHQEDLVYYLQINLGEGRGLLFVPVNTRLNKASPVYLLICFVMIGVLRGN